MQPLLDVLHKCQIVKTEIMEICFVSQLAINVGSRSKDTSWSIWYMIRKIQMVYGVFKSLKIQKVNRVFDGAIGPCPKRRIEHAFKACDSPAYDFKAPHSYWLEILSTFRTESERSTSWDLVHAIPFDKARREIVFVINSTDIISTKCGQRCFLAKCTLKSMFGLHFNLS